MPFSSSVFFHGQQIVEIQIVEHGGHGPQFEQNRAPLGLGGVGGEDGQDEQIGQQVADLVGGQPVSAKRATASAMVSR